MKSHPDNKANTKDMASADIQKKSAAEPFFPAKNDALPDQLQQSLETSFNHDFSNVHIQKDSERARELQALAFTEGEAIHFAPGQFNPGSSAGKNLIGHEFAHVVQQRSGVVQPTAIMGKGIALNDDRGLEAEADALGKKAVAGEIIGAYRSSALGIRHAVRTVQAKSGVIQRYVDTFGGRWDTEQYDLKKDSANGRAFPAAAGVRGVDMKLKFTPGNNVNAELIGLTQSVQAFVGGAASYTNPTNTAMSITAADAIGINTGAGETDEGTAIDRAPDFNNPIYAVQSLPSTSLDDANTAPSWGQHGWHYTDMTGPQHQDAKLIDKPRRPGAATNSRHIFETTALATKGAQAGTYYGSVRWGWRTDSAGLHTKIPLTKVSDGTPSSTFMKAAEIWNTSKSATGANTVDLPIQDVKIISNVAGVNIGLGPTYTHLPMGTRVRELPVFVSMTHTRIQVVHGPFTGETGDVPNSDLRDERP
jgi:hypothetical protein